MSKHFLQAILNKRMVQVTNRIIAQSCKN